MRLLGFERVELQAGEARKVTLTADPRLLARFDAAAGRWHIADGTYRVALSRSADDHQHEATVAVAGRTFGA
jgi:beta-glucosidase